MKKKKHDCHHEWVKSYEECIIFDDGAGEHTSTSPKWTCKKCGRVLRVDPNTQNYGLAGFYILLF